MPEATINSNPTQVSNDVEFDSVCIDVPRIYDSCGAKDCLSDLPVFFNECDQGLVNSANSVRINKASVCDANVSVEPVAFHAGFYSVDMVFNFSVCCDVYSGKGALPTTINGVATYGKRVVLYGSSGNVKSFSNESCDNVAFLGGGNRPNEPGGGNNGNGSNGCCRPEEESLPKATVNISSPMALSAKLVNAPCNISLPFISDRVLWSLGGPVIVPTQKQVLVTLGIFTITRLQRNVQLLIPSYDFCVPRKECAAKTDDPCEVFSQIEFPTDSFFPPNSTDSDTDSSPAFKCGCCNSQQDLQ